MSDPAEPLFLDLDQFFQGQGIQLIEVALRTVRGNTSVHIVLTSSSGLGIDDLSKVHRSVVPKLESILQTEELSVELSTPGLERNLKYWRELTFFQGKKVRLLIQGESEWREGMITQVTGEELSWQPSSGPEVLLAAQILKAKLHDL